MHKHKFCNMINMHEVSVTVCCLCDPVGRNFLLYRIIENRSLLLLGACTNIYLIVDFHTHTHKNTHHCDILLNPYIPIAKCMFSYQQRSSAFAPAKSLYTMT